ncbi:MAG: 2-isopropylmalate synthase [bacterium]|nr:2-isopropylmalate synthase [bacterium]
MEENTNIPKYIPPVGFDLPERQWPARTVTKSPIWCSVDLRDGNQALPNPLRPDQKLEYFQLLCNIGFKHIEVAFPSASEDDFAFVRRLIEENHIPDDVFIMGLTQCRKHLVERTFESIAGLQRGIVHLYAATSDLHMEEVFELTRAQTIQMVVESIKLSRQLADDMPDSDIRLEFSPEEFTATNLDFAVDICEAAVESWGLARPDKPMILNLPATVERRPPNHYADMIELFISKFSSPEKVIISLHSHNDQGMAIAASELALLAGAQRVEGTLFGHGERTGNVDLVTLACNLHSRGVDTHLDFSDLPEIAKTVEKLTAMPIPARMPYSGEYVFTAFSGSHQDAIRKGMARLDKSAERFGAGWCVPYLHMDPADLGKRYESLIRINSQSGKGGVAWVLEQDYGIEAPKAMHPEIGQAVQRFSEGAKREITSTEVHTVFNDEFVNPQGPYELLGYWPRPDDDDPTQIHGEVHVKIRGEETRITSDGNGPISAFVHCMRKLGAPQFTVDDYHEQAVGKGANATAMAYVPLKFDNGKILFGVGIDTNIDQAAIQAIIAGLNRHA